MKKLKTLQLTEEDLDIAIEHLDYTRGLYSGQCIEMSTKMGKYVYYKPSVIKKLLKYHRGKRDDIKGVLRKLLEIRQWCPLCEIWPCTMHKI